MRKKRLLVVDDEENMRHMLTELLKGEDYAVESAGNGKELSASCTNSHE